MPDYAALESLVAEVSTFARQLENVRDGLRARGFERESAASWLEWCERSLPKLDDIRRRFSEFNFTLIDEEVPADVRSFFLTGLDGLDLCREGVAYVRDILAQVVVPLLEIEGPGGGQEPS